MREILVVEDHPLVAEATANLLLQAFSDVEIVTASTAPEAMQLLRAEDRAWYRIFLDLAVPGAIGLSLAKHVASLQLASICCVISAYDRSDYFQTLEVWGFLGYVAKSTPVGLLTTRIEDVMRGSRVFPVTSREEQKRAVRLTTRQVEILEGIQQGLSSKQIAAQQHLAQGTVNNQVAGLMQLLNAESRSHAVAKAISLGLLDTCRSLN